MVEYATSRKASVPNRASCGAVAACANCWAHGTEEIMARSRIRHVDQGADLVAQGSSQHDVLTVLEGWVSLYTLLEDGRRQILQFAIAGDVLVPPPDNLPLTYGVQAVTPAVICAAPLHDSSRIAAPALSERLLAISARSMILAFEHITMLGQRTARERVALILVELYYRCRRTMPPDRAVKVPLTQSLIGDALGLTSVHVNRTLKPMREDGLIDYVDRTLRILDPDKLAAAGRFDAQAAQSWTLPFVAVPSPGLHCGEQRYRVTSGSNN